MGDFLPHREAVCFYLPVLLRTSTYYRGLLLLSAADTPHTRTCQEQRQRDYGELWQPLTSSCKGCAGGARGTALSTLCMKTQDRPITYTMYGTWRCFTPNYTLISNLNLHTLSFSHAILDHFQPLDGCISNQQTHCVIGHGWAGAWLPQADICHRHTARKCRLFRHRLVFVSDEQLIHFSCPPQTHSSRFSVSIILSYWFLA